MVSMEDITAIYLLADLTEQMRKKLCPVTESRQFKEGEVIYEEGDRAENFYMLKRGKILLEVEISKQIIIALESIKPGDAFGWSALIPGSSQISYAVCTDPCHVLVTPGEKFVGLLKEDHTMGYKIMDATMRILKTMLDRRTGQLLKVMSKQPDLRKLWGP